MYVVLRKFKKYYIYMLLGKYLKGLKKNSSTCTCIHVRKYFGGFGRNSESKSVFALSICIKGILTYNTDQTQSDPGPQDHEAISALIKSTLQSVIK